MKDRERGYRRSPEEATASEAGVAPNRCKTVTGDLTLGFRWSAISLKGREEALLLFRVLARQQTEEDRASQVARPVLQVVRPIRGAEEIEEQEAEIMARTLLRRLWVRPESGR